MSRFQNPASLRNCSVSITQCLPSAMANPLEFDGRRDLMVPFSSLEPAQQPAGRHCTNGQLNDFRLATLRLNKPQ